jgi:hypothetical protein
MAVLLPAARTFRPFLGNTLHPWCVTRIHKALSRVVVAVGLSIRRTLKTGHCDFQNQPLGPETGQYLWTITRPPTKGGLLITKDLEPASSAVPATAANKQYHDDNDQKGCGVHIVLPLGNALARNSSALLMTAARVIRCVK